MLAVIVGLTGCGSSGTSASGQSFGSANNTGPSSSHTSTASADNPGDPNTPCSVTFTLGGGVLSLSITTEKAGELVIMPYVNGTGDHGHYLRRDIQQAKRGAIAVNFKHVTSVDQIPTVLYTSASSTHSCSVVRQGDPPP
jgi:hypothetical protein